MSNEAFKSSTAYRRLFGCFSQGSGVRFIFVVFGFWLVTGCSGEEQPPPEQKAHKEETIKKASAEADRTDVKAERAKSSKSDQVGLEVKQRDDQEAYKSGNSLAEEMQSKYPCANGRDSILRLEGPRKSFRGMEKLQIQFKGFGKLQIQYDAYIPCIKKIYINGKRQRKEPKPCAEYRLESGIYLATFEVPSGREEKEIIKTKNSILINEGKTYRFPFNLTICEPPTYCKPSHKCPPDEHSEKNSAKLGGSQ